MSCNNSAWDADRLFQAIALLGYPFPQQKRTPRENAGTIIINALSADDMEARIIESLPRVMVYYISEIDWDWLISEAKLRGIQNRLGLIVNLASQGADKLQKPEVAAELRKMEDEIKRFRSPSEDALFHHEWATPALRQYILETRSGEAKKWNIITSLKFGDLQQSWEIEPMGKTEFQRRLQAGEFEGPDREANLRRYREDIREKP